MFEIASRRNIKPFDFIFSRVLIKMYRVKPTRVVLSPQMVAAYANVRVSIDRFPGIFFSARKVIS
ncbi:MAG: hypothetical protein EBS60_04480, partial [Verrucomicrobia bacterium]|nr:hypothetical protein [Verrucomicrobiota bacterium]